MNSEASVRLDKWLWAIRAFKTRGQAAVACRLGHIALGGQAAKASRKIRVGEVITVKTAGLVRTLRVLRLIEQRVGASLVPQFMEDQTPAVDYETARERTKSFPRSPGAGRPTKKDRRRLEAFFRLHPSLE